MIDVKPLVAKNITALRQNADMTQFELASALNYSDKAVSKWERGESVPDVSVLCEIARLFGVTIDWLVTDHDGEGDPGGKSDPGGESDRRSERSSKNRAFVTAMSVLLVWLVAATVFVILDIVLPVGTRAHLLSFVYAVPASLIVWLVLNTVWFDRRRNFLIISLLTWAILGSVALTTFFFSSFTWKLLILGLPGQLMILLWSKIDLRSR